MAERDIMLYGGDLPSPLYVLRIPVKGTPWAKLMRAAKRLVKALTSTPKHKAAPYWNIDGDPPSWDTTEHPRYRFNAMTGEFEKV